MFGEFVEDEAIGDYALMFSLDGALGRVPTQTKYKLGLYIFFGQ